MPRLSASELIRNFYAARAGGDLNAIREFIARDVRWIEPNVEGHMGEIRGVDQVIDMMSRAQATTDGTFSLEITEAVEIEGHSSVVVHWTARKSGKPISGRELATFSIEDGKIVFAQFLPENIRDDHAFWA